MKTYILIAFFLPGFVYAYDLAPRGTTLAQLCEPLLTRPVTYGMRSKDVIVLQEFLLRQGFEIPAGATGYYGVQTRAAVSEFQTRYMAQILFPLGLSAPTGNVYSATLAQINALQCMVE